MDSSSAPIVFAGFYAGIGSRETPPEILALMAEIARKLASLGWIVRSGGADGADTAFEEAVLPHQREIYLPWPGFNQRRNGIVASNLPHYREARELTARYHPASSGNGWPRIEKLMTRNAFQVLGRDLMQPCTFVLCWAPKPKLENGRVIDVNGGTGQAVRIAAARGIPVYNLVLPEHRARIERFLLGQTVAPSPPAGQRPRL